MGIVCLGFGLAPNASGLELSGVVSGQVVLGSNAQRTKNRRFSLSHFGCQLELGKLQAMLRLKDERKRQR